MTLKVIGAGFGRTGTLSLKAALEMLGFSPCYHMTEVFQNPDHKPVWEQAALGHPPDWREFLGPYGAAVDWPACYFWRELMVAFPDAKVLLTERNEESWYKSMSQTIFPVMEREAPPGADETRATQMRMARLIVREKTFGNDTGKANAIAVYRAHNAAVKAAVPKDRLLVFDAPDGWPPLCRFLGVPVPSEPYPRSNSSEEFRARAQMDS